MKLRKSHRVDVYLVAEGSRGADRCGVDLGCDTRQRAKGGRSDLAVCHSASGLCSNPLTSARKSPPECPSVARWSAASVAVTTGRAASIPFSAQARSVILPEQGRDLGTLGNGIASQAQVAHALGRPRDAVGGCDDE